MDNARAYRSRWRRFGALNYAGGLALSVGIVLLNTLLSPSRAADPPTVTLGPAPLAAEFEALRHLHSTSAERALRSMLDSLGPMRRHFVDLTKRAVEDRRIADENYAAMTEEKRQGRWVAALASDDPENKWAIYERFKSTSAMKEFLRNRKAVVEVWFYTEDEQEGRRLSSREVAELKESDEEAPTYLTVTYRDPSSGTLVRGRLEFGFGAAAEALSSGLAYRRHRELQQHLRAILGTRGSDGNLSASAQWAALQRAVRSGSLSMKTMPSKPANERDLFHAFECRTDLNGNITSVVRVFKASEIKPRLIDGTQKVEVRPEGTDQILEAVAWQPPLIKSKDVGGLLETSQLLGHAVEMRMRHPEISDPRRWTRLEFGEPSLLRRKGLSEFGLVNAHMEDARKSLSLRKAKIDRFAEPVFAGLNIGGGVAGVGTPLGESARLGYNLLIGRKYTPDVPSVEELRDLFALYLAKVRDPATHGKLPDKLSRRDMRKLRATAKKLTNQQIDDALQSIDDVDVRAMLQLSRRQHFDQKYRLFADILTDLAKVTGETKSGIIKHVFDNKRMAPNGDISLSTLLALAFDEKQMTPLSDYTLEDLANGDGPTKAWLQFFNVTLDVRAIANTVYLIRKKDEIDRELQKPFAHAPRMSDLASYEIRLFGYPLLLRYKRGLLEDDLEAYRNDYAYGILGTKVIARFPTQLQFYQELRNGNMAPIGFVKIPGKKGFGRKRLVESNLPVFGYRITRGKHAGKTAIIVYGMKAHRDYSRLMARELNRFNQFEQMLHSGGVLERVVGAQDADSLPLIEFEPRIVLGADAVDRHFSDLLSDLTDYDRFVKFSKWGIERSEEEAEAFAKLRSSLRSRGVDVSPGANPLKEVDDHFGSFVYRKIINGRWRLIQAIHFPSMDAVRSDVRRMSEAVELERKQRESAEGDEPTES